MSKVLGYVGRWTSEDGEVAYTYARTGLFSTSEGCRTNAYHRDSYRHRDWAFEVVTVEEGEVV